MDVENDIQAQLKEYSQSKHQEYAMKKGAGSRSAIAPTERTPLVSGPIVVSDPVHEGENSNCFCTREVLSKCCSHCQCLSNSVQVGLLPIGEGVPLRIHYLWPFFLILSAFPAFYTSTIVGIFSLVLAGPILFVTVLLHEMGHAAVARHLGGEVSQILIWPLGGLAYISFFGDSNPKADALVAIAGPLTHIPQFLVWYSAMYVSNGGVVRLLWPVDWGFNFWLSLCSAAMLLQITLFAFNLIPAYPLDGGRLLGALLSWLNFNRNTVFKATAFVGSIFGLFFLFEGMRSASSKSFTFYSSGNEMAIGVFILLNCFELWMLGARGAASLHPGYEWADGRHTSAQLSSAPPNHRGAAVPVRGVRNIHGPADLSTNDYQQQHPQPHAGANHSSSRLLFNAGAREQVAGSAAASLVAHKKMPGAGHRLGSADDNV